MYFPCFAFTRAQTTQEALVAQEEWEVEQESQLLKEKELKLNENILSLQSQFRQFQDELAGATQSTSAFGMIKSSSLF